MKHFFRGTSLTRVKATLWLYTHDLWIHSLIHWFTHWTVILLILLIPKSIYTLLHFLPDLETLFPSFSLMSEQRRDAPSSFTIHLFSAQVIFLLFNTILFPSFQLLPSHTRNTYSPSLFLALFLFHFDELKRTCLWTRKYKSSAGDPLVTSIRETMLGSENRHNKVYISNNLERTLKSPSGSAWVSFFLLTFFN